MHLKKYILLHFPMHMREKLELYVSYYSIRHETRLPILRGPIISLEMEINYLYFPGWPQKYKCSRMLAYRIPWYRTLFFSKYFPPPWIPPPNLPPPSRMWTLPFLIKFGMWILFVMAFCYVCCIFTSPEFRPFPPNLLPRF